MVTVAPPLPATWASAARPCISTLGMRLNEIVGYPLSAVRRSVPRAGLVMPTYRSPTARIPTSPDLPYGKNSEQPGCGKEQSLLRFGAWNTLLGN